MSTHSTVLASALSIVLGCAGTAELGSGAEMDSESNDTNDATQAQPTTTSNAGALEQDCSRATTLCDSAPLGTLVSYGSAEALEALVIGVWQDCDGTAFPSEFGVGMLVSSDHTWNGLEIGPGGRCVPITEGFEGFGAWETFEAFDGAYSFIVRPPGGGGAGFRPLFTDSGRMRLDASTALSDYVRLSD